VGWTPHPRRPSAGSAISLHTGEAERSRQFELPPAPSSAAYPPSPLDAGRATQPTSRPATEVDSRATISARSAATAPGRSVTRNEPSVVRPMSPVVPLLVVRSQD